MAEPTELDAFRQEVSEFLDANAQQRRGDDAFEWGRGSDRVALFRDLTPAEELREVQECVQWRKKVFDAGFGLISAPTDVGGRGLLAKYERIYDTAERRYDVPSRTPLGVSLGIVAPTLLAHASPEQRKRWVPPLARGDLIACQLFSEPEAGSDLSNVQTRATRDGDEWILNGQKVWSSGAHFSDIAWTLTRTSGEKGGHDGLTMFVVDVKAPGVEIRPLRQMTGGSSFNEVFFDDVRVEDSSRVGDESEGWALLIKTLMIERGAIGGPAGGGSGLLRFERFAQMANAHSRDGDPRVRDLLMRLYCGLETAKFTRSRSSGARKPTDRSGPAGSIGKVALIRNLKLVEELVTLVVGPGLVADSGTWGSYAFAELLAGIPGLRIGGGTDEIQLNTIAERVLGLPKTP